MAKNDFDKTQLEKYDVIIKLKEKRNRLLSSLDELKEQYDEIDDAKKIGYKIELSRISYNIIATQKEIKNIEAKVSELEDLVNKLEILSKEETGVLVLVNAISIFNSKAKEAEEEFLKEDKNTKAKERTPKEEPVVKVTGSKEAPKDISADQAKNKAYNKKAVVWIINGVVLLAAIAIIANLANKNKKVTSSDAAKDFASPSPRIEQTYTPESTPVQTEAPTYGDIRFDSVTNDTQLNAVTDYYYEILKNNGFNMTKDDVRDSILTLNGVGNLVEHKDYTMLDCVTFVDSITNANADSKKELSLAEMYTDTDVDAQTMMRKIDEAMATYKTSGKTKEGLQQLLDLAKAIAVDDKYGNNLQPGAIFTGIDQFLALGQEYVNYQEKNGTKFTTPDDVIGSLTFEEVFNGANGINNKPDELSVKNAATRALGLSLEKRDCLK